MLRPILPCLDYVINHDFIAEVLCINKDKPELQCKGKCHLMKQLEKQNESSTNSEARLSMEFYPIGFVLFFEIPNTEQKLLLSKVDISYLNNYTFLYKNKVFHPPSLALQ